MRGQIGSQKRWRDLSIAPARPRPGPAPAVTRGREPGLWRHKWADRRALAADEAELAPAVVLYVADDATVLETSRGNVFLLADDGALVTPPLRDDLLPGVTRRALLDRAADRGVPTRLAPFTPADLSRARALFWTSSLSGLVPITAVDGVELARADDWLAEFAEALGFGPPERSGQSGNG